MGHVLTTFLANVISYPLRGQYTTTVLLLANLIDLAEVVKFIEVRSSCSMVRRFFVSVAFYRPRFINRLVNSCFAAYPVYVRRSLVSAMWTWRSYKDPARDMCRLPGLRRKAAIRSHSAREMLLEHF